MLFHRIAQLATLLAFCVIVLGAYVRLSDAGLGCPDWPGCYGLIDVPDEAQQIDTANAAYPERPVSVAKAWKEMIHRYFAGLLGLLIATLAGLAWIQRRRPGQALLLPLLLLGLVIFQSLLGMWTVTWQLKPVVVTAHLLGGMATIGLLWWLVLRHGAYWQDERPDSASRRLRPWALLGLIVIVVQITLGGWTSTNYAALACTDFPTCQAQWWPPMNFREAFVLWRGLGVDYEYGVLDNPSRVAIHMTHRLGAVIVLLYIAGLSWQTVTTETKRAVRITGIAIAGLLCLQLALGIANVVLSLPLAAAVAHNGVAALLLLALITLNHLVRPRHQLLGRPSEKLQ